MVWEASGWPDPGEPRRSGQVFGTLPIAVDASEQES